MPAKVFFDCCEDVACVEAVSATTAWSNGVIISLLPSSCVIKNTLLRAVEKVGPSGLDAFLYWISEDPIEMMFTSISSPECSIRVCFADKAKNTVRHSNKLNNLRFIMRKALQDSPLQAKLIKQKAQESVLATRPKEWRPSHCPNQLERATQSPTLLYMQSSRRDSHNKYASLAGYIITHRRHLPLLYS